MDKLIIITNIGDESPYRKMVTLPHHNSWKKMVAVYFVIARIKWRNERCNSSRYIVYALSQDYVLQGVDVTLLNLFLRMLHGYLSFAECWSNNGFRIKFAEIIKPCINWFRIKAWKWHFSQFMLKFDKM